MKGPENFDWDEAMEKAKDLSLEEEAEEGVDPRNDTRGMEAANDDGPDDLVNETDAHRELKEGLDEAA